MALPSQLHGAARAGVGSLPFRSVRSALRSLLPLAPRSEASCPLFAVDRAIPQKEGWEEHRALRDPERWERLRSRKNRQGGQGFRQCGPRLPSSASTPGDPGHLLPMSLGSQVSARKGFLELEILPPLPTFGDHTSAWRMPGLDPV